VAFGVYFSGVAFLTMLPATAFGVALRVTGVRGVLLGAAAAMALAVSSSTGAGTI
jgi:hypothetical protein